VERWAAARGLPLDTERFGGRFGRASVAAGSASPLDVAVLEPLTFMNRSGACVAEALRGLGIEDPSADLLVVFDDVDLPFGRLRLRPSGSPGGHRGLADVIAALGCSDLPRLRFGVGLPEGEADTVDWVLGPFSAEEAARLEALVDAAAEAIDSALFGDFRAAMSRVNRAPASEGEDPIQ